jgi:hypothetical protein
MGSRRRLGRGGDDVNSGRPWRWGQLLIDLLYPVLNGLNAWIIRPSSSCVPEPATYQVVAENGRTTLVAAPEPVILESYRNVLDKMSTVPNLRELSLLARSMECSGTIRFDIDQFGAMFREGVAAGVDWGHAIVVDCGGERTLTGLASDKRHFVILETEPTTKGCN